MAAQTASDAKGAYGFAGIAPGTYSVVGEKLGLEAATATVTVQAGTAATADLTLLGASQPQEEITVTAQRLEEARIGIQSQVGASTYSFSSEAINNMTGGGNAAINQVLLQAPGVNQDNLANGAIHIRNEHLDVQYRINGIVLPEGVSFFGQGVSPRFANSLQLITGALPAEYGLRTAGIVDIQTKSGLFQPGGSVGMYGGSYATLQPSFEYGGSASGYNYYVSADLLSSEHGLDPVTPSYNQIHDNTIQDHGFAYIDKIIDPTSKIAVIAGTFIGQFQIPNNPGQPATFTVNGNSNFSSAALTEHQNEASHYGIVSYLRAEEDLDFQVSAFSKYSTLNFHPDVFGDLAFNGIAQEALRQSFANGLQADASYKLTSAHTLRAGALVTGERASTDTSSFVEFTAPPAPGSCTISDTPCLLLDNHAKTGWTYSAYVQDEWRITPDVTLNFGGRFDAVNAYTQESQFSPRLNGVWKATPTTTVHAGYANYFTPPPFELVSTASVNLFANTTAAFASPQSSSVKAERAQYFDAGVTQEILPGLKVGVDAYYKYARNLLDETQFGAPVSLTPFNYHVGFNRGVELTTSYDKGPFSYYGNLALAQQKAEQITSSQAFFTPADLAYVGSHLVNTDHSQRLTASAGVSYVWMDTRFSVDVIAGSGVRTTNAGDNFNEATVPSYEQVNFGVSHRFEQAPGGPIEIRADLINALDEIYLIRGQAGVGIAAPQYGPRRTFFVGLRKEF